MTNNQNYKTNRQIALIKHEICSRYVTWKVTNLDRVWEFSLSPFAKQLFSEPTRVQSQWFLKISSLSIPIYYFKRWLPVQLLPLDCCQSSSSPDLCNLNASSDDWPILWAALQEAAEENMLPCLWLWIGTEWSTLLLRKRMQTIKLATSENSAQSSPLLRSTANLGCSSTLTRDSKSAWNKTNGQGGYFLKKLWSCVGRD